MKPIILSLLMLAISGCALLPTSVDISVERFSHIKPFKSKKIAFHPINDEQSKSIEYKEYKNYLTILFSKHNIQIVDDKTQAEWLIGMSYGTTGATTNYYTSPIFGKNMQIVATRLNSQIVNGRFLYMSIVDISSNQPESIWEASLTSEGSLKTFGAISKCAFEAVLKDFPGKSHEYYSTSPYYFTCN